MKRCGGGKPLATVRLIVPSLRIEPMTFRRNNDFFDHRTNRRFKLKFTLVCFRLKIAFKWLVRAFAGYLATDQLLLLWDRIVGYGSLILLPILAVAIFLFRQSNLLLISNASGVEVSRHCKTILFA